MRRKILLMMVVFVVAVHQGYSKEEDAQTNEKTVTAQGSWGVELKNVNSKLRRFRTHKNESTTGFAVELFYNHSDDGITQYLGYVSHEFEGDRSYSNTWSSQYTNLKASAIYTGLLFELNTGTKVRMLFNAEVGQSKTSNSTYIINNAIYTRIEGGDSLYYGYGLGFKRSFGNNDEYYVTASYVYRNYGIQKGSLDHPLNTVQDQLLETDSIDVSIGVNF